jgi:hypothetical protein
LEVSDTLGLVCEPGATPVTFTLTAHDELAATVPLVKLMVAAPGVAVTVPAHVLESPLALNLQPRGQRIREREAGQWNSIVTIRAGLSYNAIPVQAALRRV